jgi:hypothetical protein
MKAMIENMQVGLIGTKNKNPGHRGRVAFRISLSLEGFLLRCKVRAGLLACGRMTASLPIQMNSDWQQIGRLQWRGRSRV